MNNKKIEQSNKIFLEAALDTINIANELTNALKDKIYDQTEQINKLSDLIYDGMFLIDENGDIFSSNKASKDIFEYDSDIRTNITNIINVDFKDNIMKKLYDIITSRNPNPYELFNGIKQNKSLFYIDVSIAKLKRSDDSIYYLMIIRDTTDRVFREQILRNLFDSYDIKSAIVNLDGNIIYSSIEFSKEFDDITNILDIFNEEEFKNILSLKQIPYGYQNILSKKVIIDNKDFIIITIN